MFRKQISPRVTAIVTIIILAAIQGVYWRLLVYRPPVPPGRGGGGGGPPAPARMAYGRRDVLVETLAGGSPGFADGPGWKARFNGPGALAVEAEGDLLVADCRNHRIRRISSRRTVVTTLAGGGPVGGAGGRADGPAADARFRFPCGVAAAASGDVFIADTGNHRVCRLRDGQVTTLAGGTPGNADGSGPAARFQTPAALAYLDGALWVADPGNHNVRRITASAPADAQVTTPTALPREVTEALGDVTEKVPASDLAASPEGEGWPEDVPFQVGRHSASAVVPGAAPGHVGAMLFADPKFHVVLARQEGKRPLLLAGLRVAQKLHTGSVDGEGWHASFAVPCAVAVFGSSAYVADFENNRIRRLRLPDWLASENEPPTRRRDWDR